MHPSPDSPQSPASLRPEKPPGFVPDERQQFERFRQGLLLQTPWAWVTGLLVLANLAVFLVMIVQGVSVMMPDPLTMIAWGANFPPRTLDGEIWRLLTSMFVHYGAFHVGMNMLALWNLGRFVERMFGNAGFLLLYLLSGLAGSLAGVFFPPIAVKAGASGAIFGVAGALLGGAWKLRRSMPRALLASTWWVGINVLILLVVFAVVNQFHSMIDNAAHVAGFLVGGICGLVLAEPIPNPDRSRKWQRRGLVAVVGGGALLLAYQFLPSPPADVAALRSQYHRVERQVLREWKSAEDRLSARAITPEEYADILEEVILPPWKNLRDDLESADNVPAEHRPLIADLLKVVRLRQAGWELTIEAIRENAPQKEAQGRRRLEEANAIIERINAQQ